MSHERVRPDDSARTLDADRRREPEPPPSSQLTPELVSYLQHGAGNAAVGRLLRETGDDDTAPSTALRTAAQFKSDSKLKSGLITLPRSAALQKVDGALAAYDLVRGTDLKAELRAVQDISMAIQQWKNSKQTPADKHAWRQAKRADEIDDLDTEQQAELQRLQQAIKDADDAREAATAARTRDRTKALLTPSVKALTDPAAKARAVFTIYMTEFRGKASYATTTPKETSIWDGTGVVACSMISNGLVDILRAAGLTAKVVQIPTERFVTKRIGAAFIDPAAEGNVRQPGGEFADERRYFFNKHWIVEVGSGTLFLDPTSGIEVSAGAPEIIEAGPLPSVSPHPPEYSNGTWHLKRVAINARGDGSYEVIPKTGETTESEEETS